MRNLKALLITAAALLLTTQAMAQESGTTAAMGHHAMMQHAGTAAPEDSRTSLGLQEPMRSHQLTRMRDHLKAVNEIVALLAAEDFDKASDIAHQRLGLTPEMQKMCSMMDNPDFQAVGIAFHQSADELGEVLKTRNTVNSLKALNRTMNYCISCHQTFRQ